MNVIYRVAISLVVALLCASFFSGYQSTGSANFEFNASAFVAFALATLITTFLTGFIPGTASSEGSRKTGRKAANNGTAKASGGRERGRVKWFNFSKGFGFISRENGEELFVHYRSIRGKGRRSLHDGQLVEFTVTESDKGLQADDVEIIKKS